MALVKFIRGNKPEVLTDLDANTLYFFEDTKEIYKGAVRYGIGDLSSITGDISSLENAVNIIEAWRTGTENADGAEARIAAMEAKVPNWDAAETNAKAYADTKADEAQAAAEAVANTKIKDVTSGNGITVTTSGASSSGDITKNIALKLSTASDNELQLDTAGLYYKAPAQVDYSIQVTSENEPDEGILKRYSITQPNVDGAETYTIDIIKDLFVKEGEVVTLNVTDEDGHEPGTYIKLTLQNDEDNPLWIPVDSLIEYVTSGSTADSQIKIAVSDDHKVTATLNKPVEKSQLADGVQTSLNKADTALQEIAEGSVTKAMLTSTLQESVDKADSALQKDDLKSGTTNGTIIVRDKTVSVGGLKSAAYTESSAYATAAQGTKADSALQQSDITTGGANGTVAVKGTDVAVKGLGSAAFTNSAEYATAAQGSNADDAYEALTWKTLS